MGFTGNIRLEAEALGWALLTGAVLGGYYDLFRILRRVFPFGYAMILGQDILFWLSSAVGVFFGSMVVYQGQLRLLFVCAALAGWGIYAATVGSLVMSVADGIISVIKKLCAVLFRRVLSPLFNRMRSAFEKIQSRNMLVIIKIKSKFRKKKEEYARKKKKIA